MTSVFTAKSRYLDLFATFGSHSVPQSSALPKLLSRSRLASHWYLRPVYW
jgi:hypothetical protein